MVAGLLERTRADPSGSAAVQSIIFYVLVVFFAVTALYFASIPLGLFALLGGALAIGLGFGSQNIINNFISGLILMLERPIRVGDMVEVEGTYGQIIRIGARCTQVQTGNNIDLMVPNSVFLESNVINWTLSDDRFRCAVAVGVAYGSPTRKVEDLLRKAALAPARVQPHPAPIVIFQDFGESALLFEVHFWIRMKSQMDRLSVESEVRFEIDRRFREEGITISFPQRDVHLTTLSPLDVRVSRDASASDAAGAE
jgi:small-conductance mechanosensitive channel